MRQSIQLLVNLWKIKELVHQQCEEINKLNKRLDYKCRHLKRLQKNYQYLEEENRKLTDLVNHLHADCYFYENYWQPIPGAIPESKEDTELPF